MTYREPASYSLLTSMRDTLADARLHYPLGRLAAAGLGAFAPLAALANPTGGQVVGGSATINTPNANATVVNQTSQNAAINWQQFSVGANQYVQFIQPNSSAVVLNRVIGSNPSSIFGNITANGQVFLINPNGILFAPGASLDVAGLVASTQDISTADFMAGRYNFTKAAGAPDATVVNQGTLSANGGYVVLAGDYVENDGVINAQSGRVVLAAGNSATLSLSGNQLISYTVNGATLARLAGVDNAGQIVADGGAVVMTGDVANALTATAVNNSGFIAAHSIKSEGGVIELLATGGDLVNSGTLDASATSAGVAGGTIILHGSGKTELMPTSVITTAGDGAKGGFIDLSGHNLAVRGEVASGKGGTILIDPAKIKIVSGGASGAGTIGTNSIGTTFIATKLNLASNVKIIASASIFNSGGAAINATGAGNLTIETGTITGAGCNVGGICVGNSTTILPFPTLGTGTINLTGLTINIAGQVNIQASHGPVTVGAITANKGLFIGGGLITVNGNLAAKSGSLDLNSNPPSHAGAKINAAGKSLSAQRVNLNLSATSYGGTISAGSINATVHASVNASVTTGTSTETIHVGAINAPSMSIAAQAKHTVMTTGALTAVNPAGPAVIHIDEKVLTGGSGMITVNGNITVSGKTAATYGALTQFGLPLTAGLFINAGGSGSADVRSVKVNGAINLTALGGAYHAGSCECGVPFAPRHLQHGTGGVAAAFITVAGSHGAASVTGNITAKGPDALVAVEAHAVQVQNITVTGSGHNVSRSLGPHTAGISYASSNSAGQATLLLGTTPPATSTGAPAVSATVKAGNLTVSGKGIADAGLFASNVSAGNVSVTATAASGKITANKGTGLVLTCGTAPCFNQNSVDFYHGISRVPLLLGSAYAGAAEVRIAAAQPIGNSASAQAATIKTGSITANGVGGAAIDIGGKTVTTLGLSAVATKGTLKGTGSSQSGITAVNTYTHSFNINGGGAEVKIRSGGSGSGVLTLGGGPVTINGNVNASGPAAGVSIKGNAIRVGGTLSVVGSGGSITSDTVFKPAAGASFHTHFVGSEPTSINIQGGASGSVSVAGKTSVKAPGIVGTIMVGGTVKLNGISGSASATRNYSVLDTRVSPTANSFTVGSFGLVVADVKVVAGTPAFTLASDAGAVNIKAAGNANLATQLQINGNLTVQAGGNIVGSSNGLVSRFNAIDNDRPRANSHSGGSGPKPGSLPHLKASATGMAFTAGGSDNLTGAAITASKGLSVTAGTKVLLTSATLTAGSAFSATGATISNGGVAATISGVGGKFDAKSGNLKLGGETLQVNGGNASLLAAGNITLTNASLLGAGSAHVTASGSIAGSGMGVNATKTVQFVANKSVALHGVTITAGTFIADAVGSISDGSVAGAVTANGMAFVAAQGNILMSGTALKIGAGSVSSVHGDTGLLQGLAAAKLSPASPNPNGAFIAGGAVRLGSLTMTGDYLLLQGSAITLLGPVTVPTGTLVQVAPIDTTMAIDIEDSLLLKSALAQGAITNASIPTSFGLTDVAFLSLFPGDTVAVGDALETGNVTLGANGPINIGTTNLIIETQGSITGLGTVTSTGIVNSLITLLAPPIPPVTSGEIDPTSGSGTNTGLGDETDKKHLGQPSGTGGDTQPAGTISSQSNLSDTCH